jgi:hypothetical protein
MQTGDPCWRGADGVAVLELPFRVFLPDGTPRTNPDEWSQDPEVLAAVGWSRSTLTAEDVAALTPPPPDPPVPAAPANWTTPGGWPLGLGDGDVGRLAALHYLSSRRHAAGLPVAAVVLDAAGVEHTLTFAELDTLLLAYSAAVEVRHAAP